MKISQKKAAFLLFLFGNFFIFSPAIAEKFDPQKCDFLENVVTADGDGVSFFDRRALFLFQKGKLENGAAKRFLDENREKLNENCGI